MSAKLKASPAMKVEFSKNDSAKAKASSDRPSRNDWSPPLFLVAKPAWLTAMTSVTK